MSGTASPLHRNGSTTNITSSTKPTSPIKSMYLKRTRRKVDPESLHSPSPNTDTHTNPSNPNTFTDKSDSNTSIEDPIISEHQRPSDYRSNGNNRYIPVLSIQTDPSETPLRSRHKLCAACDRSFSVFRAKHTCKFCRQRICDDCSKHRFKLDLPHERKKGSRICDVCVIGKGKLDHKKEKETGEIEKEMDSDQNEGQNWMERGSDGRMIEESEKRMNVCNFMERLYRKNERSHLTVRHWLAFCLIGIAVAIRICIRNENRICAFDICTAIDNSQSRLLTQIILKCSSFMAVAIGIITIILYDEVLRRLFPSKSLLQVIPPGQEQFTVPFKTTHTDTIVPSKNPHPVSEQLVHVEIEESKQKSAFSFETFLDALDQCNNDPITMENFLNACNSICSFILIFGRATSFAGSTVHNYIDSIQRNLKSWPPSTPPWDKHSVQSIIEREVQLNLANMGGKKKPSCARCILRLLWFIEFVEACLRYIFLSHDCDTAAIAVSKAYEETLGTRHPWLIRKGVMSALGSVPSKESILYSLHTMDKERLNSQLRQAQKKLKEILNEMNRILEEHSLMELK